MRFDDARHTRAQTITLRGLPPPTSHRRIEAKIDEDLRSGDDRWISQEEGFYAAAAFTDDGNVKVCVEIDPNQVADLHPGQYEGAVRVTATGLKESVAIPIVVTFRASFWEGIGLAFGGVLLGVMVKIFSELATGTKSSNPGAAHTLLGYLKHWSFPVALAVGLVTGLIGFAEIYDANRVWGASGADTVRLFGTCFGFQMGGAGGIDLVRSFTGQSAR